MREIKFRGWNGKKMLNDILKVARTPEWVFQGVPIPAYCTFSWSMSSIQEVMQFTGLHDVNGVEIYEDDIVELLFDDGTSDSMKVVYKAPVFQLEGFGVWSLFSSSASIKVVGNIYQTPELLK